MNKDAIREENEGDNAVKKIDNPKVGMIFDTSKALFKYYSDYATQEEFIVIKSSHRKYNSVVRYITLACNRGRIFKSRAKNSSKTQTTTKLECQAKVSSVLCTNGKWCVSKVQDQHNHVKSPSHARFFCRVIPSHVQRALEFFDKGGIGPSKTFNTLSIQANGFENLSFSGTDVQNCMAKARRLRLGKGDASVIQKYFSKMQENNSKFFYRFDIDDKGYLKNVFWADERSKSAYEEFGNVVTFDTTYLTNKYDMPFASFVGVNHHGQSTLLRCGLISKEDTKTFTWLFEAWLACMGGCPLSGIITDQDRAMTTAIENVFPNSRHRWCLWHIMKKLPEKLSTYKEYDSIKHALQNAVYDSLTLMILNLVGER